jgi:hypothetical protein
MLRVDSQMMDMIRVIDWWPRVYTSQPKIKSKAAIRGRSRKTLAVVAETTNNNTKF